MEVGGSAAPVAMPQDGKRTSSPDERDVLRAARLDGSVFDSQRSVLVDEDEDFSDEDDELYDTDYSDSDTHSDADSDADSETEFEDDEDPRESGDGEAVGSTDLTVAPVEFLGEQGRFASVESTAGFMLVRAGDDAAESGHSHRHGGGEITVHYRYVRFTRDDGDGPGGVELYNGAKMHPVRFLLPSHAAAAADLASSLRLAGAVLADMVYPRRFSAQLQALWSNLVAASPVRGAARVAVTVSVGILRRGDRTPERMASMRAALAVTATEPYAWPFLRNVGVVMHLPAPVSVDDDVRPAKRRRIAGVEEECAICYETLERGLAAWPRCSHVFHGECLERLLVRGDQRCPLCRSELKGPGWRVNTSAMLQL